MLTKGKASKVTAEDASPKLLTDIVEGSMPQGMRDKARQDALLDR